MGLQPGTRHDHLVGNLTGEWTSSLALVGQDVRAERECGTADGQKMSSVRRSLVAVLTLAVIAPLTLTACQGGDDRTAAAWIASAPPSAPASGGASTEPGNAGGVSAAKITLSPANGK